MNYQSIVLFVLIISLSLFCQLQIQAQCEDPLSLNYVQAEMSGSCTDSIFYFNYNMETYIYVTRKNDCLAVDWSNTLYNCSTDSKCSVFGLTLPSEQCDNELLRNIVSFFTAENAIFPKMRNCKTTPNIYAEQGDVYVDESCYGVILTAPNGNCFRLKVQNSGSVNAEPVLCPK